MKKMKIDTNHESLGTVKKNILHKLCSAKTSGIQKERGITLIALIITILLSYDEKLKCYNSKVFLLATI